ncbi:uncharacterized protein LOC113506459 [Trichoplusia ni]|uniref:Uncharacterized protein LOC113506459 n=1 Tax=Trichoplusia ni TaxID=7111 RepID=A0A7E5WW84_TRINI|nr:uncharacterized protein LOC113506459 [Trichoplusia ni]
MKFTLALFVLALVAMAYGKPQSGRGCIYVMGRCFRECEVGTHAYTTGCGFKTPEPTCAEPNPQPETHKICDYSACYCDEGTVRDPVTKQCVALENCTKQ